MRLPGERCKGMVEETGEIARAHTFQPTGDRGISGCWTLPPGMGTVPSSRPRAFATDPFDERRLWIDGGF